MNALQSLRARPRADSAADDRPGRVFHLSTIYPADESRPGYEFSGSAARTSSFLRDTSDALGGQEVFKVRMRNPFRASREEKDRLDLRFTLGSTLCRVPLGGAGLLGSKAPLSLMEYMTNGFDPSPLRARLARGRGLLIFDHLAAFAYAGWGRGVPPRTRTLYLSHDYEPEFARERYLSAIIRKRIDSSLRATDLLVVASERDRISYLSHGVLGEDKMLVYPNIFPPGEEWAGVPEFERSSLPFTLAAVETGWLGPSGVAEDAEVVGSALGMLPRKDKARVLVFGERLGSELKKVLPDHVGLISAGRVPGRDNFLKALSGAHAGVNLAHWSGGTNVKKYDFALAGLVVLSNPLGARGGLIPNERVFSDPADLAAKLSELVEQGSARVVRMGEENSRAVRAAAEGASESLTTRLRELLSRRGSGGG